jgi:GNAT superfamily N-acetyltransferase
MIQLKARYMLDRIEGNLLDDEQARHYTEQQWHALLPDGQATCGHSFLNLIVADTDEAVGSAWLFVDSELSSAFIYELFLDEEQRGRGLGRASLEALETLALDQGAATLGLNVFASNTHARALYESYGFSAVSTDMIKRLRAT